MVEEFDAIIIGAGEAGTQVESMAVPAGKKVALIYNGPYGATCLNYGCIPSKFMIARARIAHLIRTADDYHISSTAPRVDLAAIVKEKDARNDKERRGMLDEANAAKNLTLIKGRARFSGDHQLTVADRTLHAPRIFIAAGMRPTIPDIAGLREVAFHTNETVMDLTTLPTHLLVLGGGYVACELGQMFRRFGSQVTIIQSNAHLVPREEGEISAVVEAAFAAEGIKLLLGSKASKVEATDAGIRLTMLGKDGKQHTVSGSHLLVATGRQSNADTLDLDAAGIAIDDKGNIKVNDYLETNVAGIYAIGNVNGHEPYTPVALEEGKVAYLNAFEAAKLQMDYRAIGHAIFTDPEIGSVGLTEQQARAQGLDVATVVTPFADIAKASLIGETQGFIKLVADRAHHKVIGCHIVGADAANLVYDAVMLVRSGDTIHQLATSLGLFPTLQEGMQQTAAQLLHKVAPASIGGAFVTAPAHHRGVGR